MAVYINTSNNAYPQSLNDIKSANPTVAFPPEPTSAQLAPYNFAVVVEIEEPPFDETLQKAEEGTPTGTNGSDYTQVWNIVALDAEEVTNRVNAAKSLKIENLWQEWNVIDGIIHVSPIDSRKSKYKHDINTVWSSYGTAAGLTPAEEANVDTLHILQDYTALLNSEIDIQTDEISALATEADVDAYVIVFSPIPAGLPNLGTISVKDATGGSEYRITSLGTTDWNTFTSGGNTDPFIGQIITAAGAGTGTGTVTATVSITALVTGEEYTIATPSDSTWTTVGAADNLSGTIFIATATGTGTGTATPSTGVGAGQAVSRIAVFVKTGSFPTAA